MKKIITENLEVGASIPFYKSKKVIIPIVAIMTLSMIMAAVGYFLLSSHDVRINVGAEPMSIVPFNISTDAMPGDVISQTIELINSGSNNYTITLKLANDTIPSDWYSSFPVEDFIMVGGESKNVTINFTISSNASISGEYTNQILIGRS